MIPISLQKFLSEPMKTEKPMTLKLYLTEYRDFLIATLEGKNPTAEEALRTSLNTDDGKNPDGET